MINVHHIETQSGIYVETVKEASEFSGVDASNIRKILKGKRKQSKGYTFEYEEMHRNVLSEPTPDLEELGAVESSLGTRETPTPAMDLEKLTRLELIQLENRNRMKDMSTHEQVSQFLDYLVGEVPQDVHFYILFTIFIGKANSMTKFGNMPQDMPIFETVMRTKRRIEKGRKLNEL
ncbi:gp41 [Listeria phage P40]|uniref:gp41 n=1 Tax=Listeria phage P40 TaxID=560178 RepID=UPI00018198F6|nr:gp41 [Listeria phage P40]ACI00401.1 gp41 [Listeria phage P40]